MDAGFLDYETVAHDDLDLTALRHALVAPGETGGLTLYANTDEHEIASRIAALDVVLTNKVRLGAAQLDHAPRLKLIALSATGTDNVDLAAAAARGIAVCNVRDYCTASVVQHVWALILALTQHLSEYARMLEHGEWQASAESAVLAHPIRELAGRTLGVVGFGALGRGVARAAPAFGMRVIVAQRPGGAAEPDRVPLDALLAESDVVSLHCPLTPTTRGLIGARELALMKRDALLINTARGALVDGRALAEALRAGRLGGAGLDVLEHEPPRPGDALLEPGVPRLWITPHVAWAAREARQRCLDEIARNIEDFRRGGRRGRVV